MVQIVDNFLPANLFARFQHLMMGAEFPWYFVLGVADHKDDDYYFIHNVYGCKEHDNGDGQKYRDVESQYFKDFEMLLHFIEEKLKFQTHELLRIKCNLYTNQNVEKAHAPHIDMEIPHHTAIFYLNSNNGPTTIGDQDVESVANRLVLFDGLTPHNSNMQTDVAERINININMRGEFLSA
tara:strand:+ start:831 stop:1373 length:543 start_codon:yes stop_codon:yes gene_type:complete